MRDFLVLALVVVLASSGGCSYSQVAPACSKRPDPRKLDSAEQTALADALSRYGGRCKRQNWQCDVSLTRNDRGDILVTVASVYPDKGSGQCLQAPGDQDLAAYSHDGTFIRRVMSL